MVTLPYSTMEYLPCKVELANPTTDWKQSWRLARLKGLGPDHTAFLWKLLHLLLPVKERVHRISPNTPPSCQLCNQNQNENMYHAFLTCTFNMGAGQALVEILKDPMPNITMDKILRLEFQELEEEMEWNGSLKPPLSSAPHRHQRGRGEFERFSDQFSRHFRRF